MFYRKNTPLQLEREFLSWSQWPLPVLLEIRCTKLQFCLELEWVKDRMDIRPHIFSLHSVSWLLWVQVTFLMLFQHGHPPCMSPSATQRSEEGNTTRDVVRRGCHGYTLEEISFAKPVSTQPAPAERCLIPAQKGKTTYAAPGLVLPRSLVTWIHVPHTEHVCGHGQEKIWVPLP